MTRNKVTFTKEGVKYTGYQVWYDNITNEMAVELSNGHVEEICHSMVESIVQED